MSSSISLRVYLITLQRRGDRTRLPFNELPGTDPIPALINRFVATFSSITEDHDKERSWHFEESAPGTHGSSKGVIHYGTFGFESNLVDTRTRKRKYKRRTTDSEVIPLFYEFWRPSKASHIFVVFQSFQGKSCVNLVLSKLQEFFQESYEDYRFVFKKLIPNDSSDNVYRNNKVQKLTLIKNSISTDLADQLTGARPSEPVKLEISLIAKRKGTVGIFKTITQGIKSSGTSIITHDGIDFDEANAMVRVGSKTRAVGIFGGTSEAGVIDLSDTVKRGPNGHPDFASICEESDDILKDFHSVIERSKREN